MNKHANPFHSPTLHTFLFCLFLALLSWPFLTIADRAEPAYTMVVYLFAIWFAMIAILFVIGQTCKKHLEAYKTEAEPQGEDSQC